MKNNLHIAFIQADLYWEDVDKNLLKFDKLIDKIKKVDIILLPEMFNTSFSIKSTHLSEDMNGKTVTWMKLKSKEKKCAISGTLMIKEGEKVYNRLVWISKDGRVNTYDKHHLFSLIREEKYITKGTGGRLIIEEQGWKICPLICYDLRFPVFSRNNIDYHILIYLANWPIKRIQAWDALLQARSIENQCFTIGVNRVGEDGNGIKFNGHSAVYGVFGETLISSVQNKVEVYHIILDSEKIKLQRRQMNFLKDRDKFTIQ